MEAEKYTIEQVETALLGYKGASDEREKERHLDRLLLYLTPLLCKKIRYYFGVMHEEERRDLLRVLSEKEERVIVENVIGGRKLITVSKEMGISYMYAKEVKRKALRKLRANLPA